MKTVQKRGSMKENVFENGYLKSEFINPNYRGLVGWPCERKEFTYKSNDYDYVDDLLMCLDVRAAMTNDEYCADFEEIKIPQFTPKDIPVGELCWMLFDDKWYLKVYNDSNLKRSENTFRFPCVPYLIAETAEKAEKLKDWDKSC